MNIAEGNIKMLSALKSKDHLLTQIRNALEEYLLREDSAPITDFAITNVLERFYSTVFFLTIKTARSSRRLVAKATVHHPENKSVTERENQAVLEFNVLQRLFPRFQQVEGCSVCRPVLVIPETETVVIDHVEGKILAEELHNARYLSSRSGFSRVQAHFYLSGRWLRHFQRFTGARFAGPDTSDTIMSRTDFRLGLIEKARDPRCPSDLRSRVMTRLNECRKQLEGQKIPVAGRHGDFGPWNILCGPEGVTVLDFFGYREEPVLVDLLGMVMALEREQNCITASPRRIELLKQSFVEGYGSFPAAPLPLVNIVETFHRVCNVQGCLANQGGWFHKRIERNRCIRSNVKWLTRSEKAKHDPRQNTRNIGDPARNSAGQCRI